MKDYDISNMGEAALTSHATGQHHIKFMEMSVTGTVSISGIFRLSSAASQDQGSQAHTSSSGSSTASTVITTECRNTSGTASNIERISTFVSPSETLSAEILWAIKVTTVQHYSERSCDGAGNIFRRMFPDSHIAEKFACGHTKCHQVRDCTSLQEPLDAADKRQWGCSGNVR